MLLRRFIKTVAILLRFEVFKKTKITRSPYMQADNELTKIKNVTTSLGGQMEADGVWRIS